VNRIKFEEYRGLYLIGDKTTKRIMNVQVVDADGNSFRVPFLVYVLHRIEPKYTTLPWRKDIKFKPAKPKS
jgi:hypothetical protein